MTTPLEADPKSGGDGGESGPLIPQKSGYKLGPSVVTTQAVLNTVSGIEGLDIQLMPASFKILQADFSWALQDLGALVFYQSISQALSGLVWGYLADRSSRVRLLATGCCSWGLVSMFLAMGTQYWQFAVLKVLNGIAMARALSAPVSPSSFFPIVKASASGRKSVNFLGCIVGALIGGSMASLTVVPGVRYIGMPDWQASVLTACPLIGGMVGSLFGGWLGDQADHWSHFHGRPLIGQMGTLISIPLIYMGLLVIPRRPEFFGLYALDMLLLGFAIAWCPSGVNRPILSEIVESDARASVFATQIVFEGSVAAMLGSPVIAFMAESLFGYSGEGASAHSEALKLKNIEYGLLHFTYPKDASS
ncbi:hypothetical protein NCLIV_050860 [Neospora caninum Liverpool]|uniref:Major facilitator superfamily (MFS) profile domain-containing protein n=1 Tax=Neospora caninum (strain Liverpool) TaxID=572307 RepID=F0VKQ7_NEOCL|nr:hypothetical protein NCLIV_050860 [Neospora caninum Liverpool]CBZ54658.1 hypothetical protein NCLIV_050860 [Neospora caninum Liverpool]|eukprot:XP_003884688.1 hypothetical protein NCLIV_050860 [Neospora caninum Liverpool]